MAKRQKRTYTEAERIPIIMAAVELGAPEAARRFGMPDSTIYEWTNELGGIVAIRETLKAKCDNSMLTARQAVTEEIRRRARDMSDEELAETFREMLKAETSRGQSPAVSVTVANQQRSEYQVDQGAVDKAVVTLIEAGALPSPNGASDGN